MFNTSLRRVARNCSNGAAVPSRPTTPSMASFTSHAHQRRHSSSKPPVPPNNGSSAIPAASVKQVGTPRSETKRPGSESRLSKKRSSKEKFDAKQEVQDDWTSKLPSVPSLQHLNPKGMEQIFKLSKSSQLTEAIRYLRSLLLFDSSAAIDHRPGASRNERRCDRENVPAEAQDEISSSYTRRHLHSLIGGRKPGRADSKQARRTSQPRSRAKGGHHQGLDAA